MRQRIGEGVWNSTCRDENFWLFRCLISASIHKHFQPIHHQSSSYPRVWEHTFGSVGRCPAGDSFAWRFGNSPTILLAGLVLEQGKDLGYDGPVVHYRPSTRASAASVWGSQKVISMPRYRSM